jgi:hypothetical protein
MAWSAVDNGHVPFVMALAGRRREVVQPFDLLGAELETVGGGVLLDAGYPLGAGDRGDVASVREPFLGMMLTLDARSIVQVASEMDLPQLRRDDSRRSISIEQLDADLLDALAPPQRDIRRMRLM